MTRAHRAAALALFAFSGLAASGTGLSCKANLESSCVDGTCGTPENANCGYPDTGGLPCDVYAVLAEDCQGCHQSPPLHGAPFPLLGWANTQDFVPGTMQPIWKEMRVQIQPGASPGMPFGKNPPGIPQKDRDVLEAWFKTCDAGACAQGHGTGTAGAGGAGASSSSSSASSGVSSSGAGTSSSGSAGGSSSSSDASSSGTGN